MSLPAPVASLAERLTAAWRERAVALKAMSFALVGLVNTAVDAAIFFLLLGYATPSLIVANVTAWFIANTGSYMMNSFTTFSAETGRKLQPAALRGLRRLRARGRHGIATSDGRDRGEIHAGLGAPRRSRSW